MAKGRKAEREHEFNLKLLELAKGAGAEGFNFLKEGMKAWGEFAKAENDMVQAAAIGIPASWSVAALTYLGLKSLPSSKDHVTIAGPAATAAGIATFAGMLGSGVVMELAEVVEHMKIPSLISF
jgi:hypothetical protein